MGTGTRIAATDLRDSWPAWLPVSLTFVATSFAVALAGLATGSASAASGDLRDLLRVAAGFNVATCTLVSLGVVSSSTGLVVGSRRGAVARLMLAGAAPGQVVRVLVLQLGLVTLLCSVAGGLLAVVAQPSVLRLVAQDRGLAAPAAHVSPGALVAAGLYCAVVAMVGGLWQARRATAIPPVEALRAANGAPDRPPRVWSHVLRCLGCAACVGVVVASVAAFRAGYQEMGRDAQQYLAQIAALSLALTGLGLALLAPTVSVVLTRFWTRLVPAGGATWHLARHTAISRSTRLVKSVVPVMFTIGLCFGMMLITDTLFATLAAEGVHDLEGASMTANLTLLGLPLLIALAGSIGNLVMMSRQRDAELALDGVIGATPTQQVLVSLFEGTIVVGTAAILGTVVGLAPALLLGTGMPLVFAHPTVSIPWGTLAVILAIVWVVTVAATVLPSLPSLRRPAPKVIARLVAS